MSAGRLVSSKEVTDPKYRRLRRALTKAEKFLFQTIWDKEHRNYKRAAARWNSIMIKAWKVMK